MSNRKIINLVEGHEDFTLAPGVRGEIVWHGQTYDLAKIDLEVAERMAREKETRYVQFSDARSARDAQALAAKVLPPARPSTEEPASKPDKDTETRPAEPRAQGGGKRGGNKPAEEPPAKE